jgi:uncharacterized membrane protein
MRELFAAPLHPVFTHFSIALTASSLLFDALGRVLDVASLSAAGWWTLAAAVPVTVGTLASGITSRIRLAVEEGKARRWLRAHMALGPSFFGGLVGMALWRGVLWTDGARLPWTYLAVMGGLVLVMTAQGYLGGELVYRFGTEVRGRYPRLPSARHDAAAPPTAGAATRRA